MGKTSADLSSISSSGFKIEFNIESVHRIVLKDLSHFCFPLIVILLALTNCPLSEGKHLDVFFSTQNDD